MSEAKADGAKAWRRTRRWASLAAARRARATVARSAASGGIAADASRAARIDETRSASSSYRDVPGGHGSSFRLSSAPVRPAVAASAATLAASSPARRAMSALTDSPFGP